MLLGVPTAESKTGTRQCVLRSYGDMWVDRRVQNMYFVLIFICLHKSCANVISYFSRDICAQFLGLKYRVSQSDCRGFNNLSYTIHLR